MNSKLIESYQHDGYGYNPFFIREDWQVAQLNYMPEQDITGIDKMDKHLQTDEVFVLIKGTAILIGAVERENTFSFQCIKMQPGITYNIPANVWHNIAMKKDAQVIIVEKSNTHLGDFIYKPLTEMEKKVLNDQIAKSIPEN